MDHVFIDANIPTYLGGSEHPLKEPSRNILATVAAHPEPFITDAEVLQELLHRYKSLRMWPEPGERTFIDFALLMRGRIEPMFAEDVQRAADLADAYVRLSARDLVHIAAMERAGATAIVTADHAFDNIDGIERLDPADAATWLPRFEDVSS
jgi:predicted nucleic acid-binding protein